MTDISGFDLRSRIREAMREVFGTMLSMEVTLAESDPPAPDGSHRTVGTIHFAGDVAGSVDIQVNTDFARRMAARTLGLEPAQGQIKDLIAEMSTLIGANLRSSLNDRGFACVTSNPFITAGTDFTIEPAHRQQFERVVFLHEQDAVIVDVGMAFKQFSAPEDDAQTPAAETTAEDVDFEKLNALDMKAKLSEAVVQVFDTMLSMELELIDKIPASSQQGRRRVTTVSFAGDVSGLVNIHLTGELVELMASSNPDQNPSQIGSDEAIKDLIAQVGNQVGVNLKSAINDVGLACELSPPRFTSGTDFEIETVNRRPDDRLAFRVRDHVVLVETDIEISEILQVAGQVSHNAHEAIEAKRTGSNSAATTDSGPRAPTAERIPPGPSASPSTGKEAEASDQKASRGPRGYDLDLILDIPLRILVELGRTKIQIRDLLQLGKGSAVKLTKLDGAPVDILANDTLIARGMVVIQNEKYAVQVTELASRMDRIKTLN